MDIKEFAIKHRVNTKQDGCNETVIPGKQFCKDMPDRIEYHSHIYDGFDSGRLGVCLLLATKRHWTFAHQELLNAGFEIKQNGEQEGCVTFDPTDSKQVKLAFKLAGIKVRRQMGPPSPKQVAARERFKTGSAVRKEPILAL
jgi:hypothetical protein